MRTSLIIVGVIFLVLGILLYFLPTQRVTADTSTTGDGSTDTRTSSARVTVPVEWAYASATIGLILLILGLAIDNPVIRTSKARSGSKSDSYEKRVESKEHVEDSDGKKHHVVTERVERHNTRVAEDD
jgi:uncharacterized membrane protein